VRPITSLAPVVLTGSVQRSIAGRPVALPFAYTCDKLVVAYAQLPDKMSALGLDRRERAVFDQVRERYYFTGELEIEGALVAVGAFNLLNLNVAPSANANGTITPTLPAITQITRGLPYGPAQVKASANAPITVEAMEQVVRDQLARFPPALLTSVRLVKLIRHVFQPHFTTDALRDGHQSGYAGLAGLQGRRDTYYLGSLVRSPITYQLWDYSLRFVSEHFPARFAATSSSSSSAAAAAANNHKEKEKGEESDKEEDEEEPLHPLHPKYNPFAQLDHVEDVEEGLLVRKRGASAGRSSSSSS
jgi:hypothetical protein